MSVVFYTLNLQTETFTKKFLSPVCENYEEESYKTGTIVEDEKFKDCKKSRFSAGKDDRLFHFCRFDESLPATKNGGCLIE